METEIKQFCKATGTPLPEDFTDYGIGSWLVPSYRRKAFWKWQDKNRASTCIYLITFTLKPDSVHLADEAEKFIISQAQRTALGIAYFAYARELTKAGVPHWHVVVRTDRILKKNRFQYYEKKFGHVDVSRTKGTTHLEALEYISKDVEPTVLIE